jgi:ADP-ribosylglycohydrolase
MQENARAAVLASFAGDSLALGAHWIYSTGKIAREFGRIETFLDPGRDSHHPTKKKGEFTPYGDQALVLLESLAATGGFDPGDFSRRWRQLFSGYTGYYDQATKGTLANLSRGRPFLEAGSPSNDIAGASRIAPLVAMLHHDEEGLVAAARMQTAMTHTDSLTVDASGFFARVCAVVLEGSSPGKALRDVALRHFMGTPLQQWVEKGTESRGKESAEVIKAFGQSCHTPEAFPGVIHLIARYEDDLKEALVQAVMAGGDSAARGMLAGMVLGAYHGMKAIPEDWLKGLVRRQEIETLLDRISS